MVGRIFTGYNIKCGTTNLCVKRRWLCDGDDDCGDGSDEVTAFCAQHECDAKEFRCTNHRCIPLGWRCDGDNDCGDSSDEPSDCDVTNRTCSTSEFTCSTGSCIDASFVCDGDPDCLDASDEAAFLGCGTS